MTQEEALQTVAEARPVICPNRVSYTYINRQKLNGERIAEKLRARFRPIFFFFFCFVTKLIRLLTFLKITLIAPFNNQSYLIGFTAQSSN